jgi:hypothetical protein
MLKNMMFKAHLIYLWVAYFLNLRLLSIVSKNFFLSIFLSFLSGPRVENKETGGFQGGRFKVYILSVRVFRVNFPIFHHKDERKQYFLSDFQGEDLGKPTEKYRHRDYKRQFLFLVERL